MKIVCVCWLSFFLCVRPRDFGSSGGDPEGKHHHVKPKKCDEWAGEFIAEAAIKEFNQADVDDGGFVDQKELFQYATRNALEGLSCPDLFDNDQDGNFLEEMVMFIPQAKYTDMQHYVGQLIDLDDNGKITIEEWDFVYYFLCDSDMSIDADGAYRDSDVIQYATSNFNLIEGCKRTEIEDGDDNEEAKMWVLDSYQEEQNFRNQNLRVLFEEGDIDEGGDGDSGKERTQASIQWRMAKGTATAKEIARWMRNEPDENDWPVTTLTKMWIDYGDNEGCCAGKVSSYYCLECYTHTSWMPSMRDDDRVDTLK